MCALRFANGEMASGEWKESLLLPTRYSPLTIRLVMILEALGQLFDVLRRPARHFHAEMQAHLREYLLDLVQGLAAEVRRAQHLGLGLLHEIADVDDVVVLQAVGRAHRELELVHLLQERR